MAKFQPGQSGNPGGRPKETAEIKELARMHGPAAIRKLVQLMKGGTPRVQVAAAQALLDRGYGRPAQTIGGDDDLPPIRVQRVERIVIHANAEPTDR